MATIKAPGTAKIVYPSGRLSLHSEKQKIRTMRILFALFSVILVLLTVLSLAFKL